MKLGNRKQNRATILILAIVTLLVLPMTAIAHTDEFKLLEVIPDGALFNTWNETTAKNWHPQNVSNVKSYNFSCNGSSDGTAEFTLNETHVYDRAWGYYEVQSNRSQLNVGHIFAYNNSNDWIGFLINQTGAGAYIVHWNGSTLHYFNATNGNWSNYTFAYDYTNYEPTNETHTHEYVDSWLAVKYVYNRYCGVKIKFWTEPAFENEPTEWQIDINHTNLTYPNSVKQGLLAHVPGAYEAQRSHSLYRRIVNWNCSYTLESGVPAMEVPIYQTSEFVDTITEIMEFDDDVWNQTAAIKAYFNMFNVESMYRYNQVNTPHTDANDTIFYYALALTGVSGYFDEFGPDAAEFLPNNMLWFSVEATNDGTDHYNDSCFLMFDVNGDGDYNLTDKAYWVSGNDTDAEFASFTGNTTDTTPRFFAWVDYDVNHLHAYRPYKWYHFLIDADELANVNQWMNFTCVCLNWDNASDDFPTYYDIWNNWDELTCYYNTTDLDTKLEMLEGPNCTSIDNESSWGLFRFSSTAGDVSGWGTPNEPIYTTIANTLRVFVYAVFVLALIGLVMASVSKWGK